MYGKEERTYKVRKTKCMKISMFSTKQTLKIWLANKTALRSEVHGYQRYSVFLPARNMRNGISR